MKNQMDPWLQENLVCPRDFHKLTLSNDALKCPKHHRYPYVDKIPIMLLEESEPTQNEFRQTLEKTSSPSVSSLEQEPFPEIDPFVCKVIGATGGYLYKGLASRLTRYPIPKLRLPRVLQKKYFLDIGCNWGRWCISAARKRYSPVGIDHNLDAIYAARRVARQMGLTIHYLVADARYLPFQTGSFDVVFSYSVLQHFKKNDAKESLSEVSRVLTLRGLSFIQMANALGLHNLYYQWEREGKNLQTFDVRYWTPQELTKTFNSLIGPSSLKADGYFSLNPQIADVGLLPLQSRWVIYLSELLRKTSQIIPGVKYFADSLYVESRKSTLNH